MKRVSRASIVTAALCVFIHGALLSIGVGAAAQIQRHRTPARSRPQVSSRIDYSKFLHSTKKHQAACVTCHRIPTSNWRKVREYPDVADYPDHEACVSCHRPQFFSGAKPAICSVCHTKISPRDDQRFAFRNPDRQRQFKIGFPHDKHQDVIADLFNRLPVKRLRLVRVSLTLPELTVQDRAQHYNNCEICHLHNSKPLPVSAGWVDGAMPDARAFKSKPDSHAYCFSCHWKTQAPINSQCGDCHKRSDLHVAAGSPKRIVMRFDHNGGGEKKEHLAECATCHVNVTKASHMKRSEIDVPVFACKQCHAQDSGSAPPKADCRKLRGSRVIGDELNCLEADKQYTCVYCHTSNFGKLEPPVGHFLAANKKRFSRKELR